MYRRTFILLIIISLFTGCKDLFEPELENIRSKNNIYDEPWFAEGLLANGYMRLPYDDFVYNLSDMATDDAVSNDPANQFDRLATGQWNVNFNPMDVWSRSYNGILYLNEILGEVDKVNWAENEEAGKLFKMRIKGEVHGLRAIFMYFLLQAHGGREGGNLLGLPIVTAQAGDIKDFNIPRADFQTYVNAIYSDLDLAEQYLPLEYGDLNVTNGQVPAKYAAEGITSVGNYNRVLGTRFRGRINATIAKSFRSRVSLLAASPAFLNGEGSSWAKAAEHAADVLNTKGGIAGLAPNGWRWYSDEASIAAIANSSNPAEIVWRGRTLTHSNISSTIEKQHFPPTLFGFGRLNPTQNIVDAFPMKNGYPINNPQSGYNAANPYAERDPRLETYILLNGRTLGPANTVISTVSGDNAVGATQYSTITGYYLKKLLNPLTNLNPATPATRMMYVARIRFTELYLNYAEAANEAYGPDGMAPGTSYTARDVIKAIRQRAGVGGANDSYLASISSKEAMRELIRNERRLELCFEGFRFWDLRRWNVSVDKLNEPIRGILGKNAAGQPVFDFSGPFPIENRKRSFQNHMIYGPIPLSETIKWSQLRQNDGWL